jgi:hypothetical protein
VREVPVVVQESVICALLHVYAALLHDGIGAPDGAQRLQHSALPQLKRGNIGQIDCNIWVVAGK